MQGKGGIGGLPLWGLTLLWGLGLLGGSASLAEYGQRPGPKGVLPTRWDPALGAQPEGFCLLLFVHPRCPCSRASLWELAELRQQLGPALGLRIYFQVPDKADAAWTDSELWELAAAIPAAVCRADPGGRLAARLGAMTSGQALLFAPNGRRCFEGGLTASRGHQGESAGLRQIRETIRSGDGKSPHTPVYGCELCGPRDTQNIR